MTTKTPVYVGETKLPDALQTGILARFMKSSDLKQFWDRYSEARIRSRTVQPPTKLQYEIAELRKKMSTREVAAVKKVKAEKVLAAMQKVAVYKFLNS